MINILLTTSFIERQPYALEIGDVCPAKAKFEIQCNQGNLFFCRHHFVKNEDQLKQILLQIIEINQES